jgi:hypothetical protein
MKTERCEHCLERRQLEVTQRIGRVGYRQYDPLRATTFQPQLTLALLAAIAGRDAEAVQ